MKMDFIKRELDSVKKELINGFNDPIPNEILTDFLVNGSKFVRSTLAICYLKALGCEITDKIIKLLTVGELIHSASLLHDDVIDGASNRRGKSTISNQFSDKISILSGDLLLSEGVKKLLDVDNNKVLKIFLDCTQKMSLTEINQYFKRGTIPSEDEYIEICNGKTAVLFSAILQSCALLSNIDVEKAKNFSEIFGICFQIKNDLDLQSSLEDRQNQIYTAKDVLGIEKTNLLLDNYKKSMVELVDDFPQNIYKEGLEGLINSL